jgi:hypothetical protein
MAAMNLALKEKLLAEFSDIEIFVGKDEYAYRKVCNVWEKYSPYLNKWILNLEPVDPNMLHLKSFLTKEELELQESVKNG